MAYCGKCGTKAENGEKYCPSCGASMEIPKDDATQKTDFSAKIAGLNNTADNTAQFEAQDIQNNKTMAILAYIGPLVLIPILAAKDSKFARYHSNQGLVLLLAEIAYKHCLRRFKLCSFGYFTLDVLYCEHYRNYWYCVPCACGNRRYQRRKRQSKGVASYRRNKTAEIINTAPTGGVGVFILRPCFAFKTRAQIDMGRVHKNELLSTEIKARSFDISGKNLKKMRVEKVNHCQQ